MAATALLALSASMAWAAVNDYDSRARVPVGVSIADTDLSAMTPSQAADAIRTAVAAPLLRPLTVSADERTFTFDPRETVTIDVDTMVNDAFAPRRDATYLRRVMHDVTGAPLTKEIQPRFSVDENLIDEWLAGLAETIDEPSRDATVAVVGASVKVKPSRIGRRTDIQESARLLREAFATERALADEVREVTLPVKTLKPKVTEKDLGKTIIVKLSERRVKLYDGAKLEKTYRCAIGSPGYPTPKGQFVVVQKRYMPTWVNPAPNGWGADMPASIGPGPGNPLGTRALNLSAPGIRFHGTTKRYSIGSAASHGCMRMLREDIEDFYDRVKVGTRVYILP
jgi:lipoprotein-anchoring transpeptidase ErfK/SrfK